MYGQLHAPAALISGEGAPGTHSTEGYETSRAWSGNKVQRKVSALAGNRTHILWPVAYCVVSSLIILCNSKLQTPWLGKHVKNIYRPTPKDTRFHSCSGMRNVKHVTCVTFRDTAPSYHVPLSFPHTATCVWSTLRCISSF